MPRYLVPVYMWIEAPSEAHAEGAKQAIERLLTSDPTTSVVVQSMLTQQLQSLGTRYIGVTFGSPKVAQQTAGAGQGRRG